MIKYSSHITAIDCKIESIGKCIFVAIVLVLSLAK